MAKAVFILYLTAFWALWATTGIFLFRAFRRSGNKGFLLLFAAVTIWPIISGSYEMLVSHLYQQVGAGKIPWLFRFSFMDYNSASDVRMKLVALKSYGIALKYIGRYVLLAWGAIVLYKNMRSCDVNSQDSP